MNSGILLCIHSKDLKCFLVGKVEIHNVQKEKVKINNLKALDI
jgi:hypothetical protein